jgi:hypothetical protein
LDTEPIEFRDDWGTRLSAGGQIVIGPDSSGTPLNPRTIEVWYKPYSGDITISTAGTRYTNGVAGTTINLGEWHVAHVVTAAPVTTNITLSGSVRIGHVALYPTALTANEVENVVSLFTGTPTVAMVTGTIAISDTGAPAEVYSYEWDIVSSG